MSKKNIILILILMFLVGILLANRWMQSQLGDVKIENSDDEKIEKRAASLDDMDVVDSLSPKLEPADAREYGVVTRNDNFSIGQAQWAGEMEKTLKKTLESNPLTLPVGKEKNKRSSDDIQKQIDKIQLQIENIEKETVNKPLSEYVERQLTNLYTLKAALEAVK